LILPVARTGTAYLRRLSAVSAVLGIILLNFSRDFTLQTQNLLGDFFLWWFQWRLRTSRFQQERRQSTVLFPTCHYLRVFAFAYWAAIYY
jgi:hypothetical protein